VEVIVPGELGVTPFEPKAQSVAAFDPGERVRSDKAVRDGNVEVARAQLLVANVVIVGVGGDLRGEGGRGSGGCQGLGAIKVRSKALSQGRIVEAIEANIEVVEKRGADRAIPAKTNVVGKAGLEEVRIQRRWDRRATVQLLLVAAAIGKEELVTRSPILVD